MADGERMNGRPVCPYCGFHDGRHWYRCSQWVPPRRYRWLMEGRLYVYRAAPGKGLDERRGQVVTVLRVRLPGRGPGNVLVEFSDGVCHMVPSGVLRSIGVKGQPVRTAASSPVVPAVVSRP